MPTFDHRGHRYEPTVLRGYDMLGRTTRVTHRVVLPDGSCVNAPFDHHFIATRDLFEEWVNLRLLPLYDVDGWSYEPERLFWDYRPHYTHRVRGPDGMTEIAYYASCLVPEHVFAGWVYWSRPSPSTFGRKVVSKSLLEKLTRIASEHDIPRDRHDALAVIGRLTGVL